MPDAAELTKQNPLLSAAYKESRDRGQAEDYTCALGKRKPAHRTISSQPLYTVTITTTELHLQTIAEKMLTALLLVLIVAFASGAPASGEPECRKLRQVIDSVMEWKKVRLILIFFFICKGPMALWLKWSCSINIITSN